jgi:hypothetical protein
MQLSNLFPALMVILIHGQAYVQCFKCTDTDYPSAACGQFLMGDKSQANDPDQDKSGITCKASFHFAFTVFYIQIDMQRGSLKLIFCVWPSFFPIDYV